MTEQKVSDNSWEITCTADRVNFETLLVIATDYTKAYLEGLFKLPNNYEIISVEKI